MAPIAERVAHSLGQAMAGKYVPVTPLTGTSQRRAQAVVKARRAATRGALESTAPPVSERQGGPQCHGTARNAEGR